MRRSIAILTTCIATAAFADCIEGMRDATPAEIQFNKRVAAALREALPTPPANWTLASVREDNVGSVCSDTPEGDFAVRVTASFSYHPPKEESDRMYAEHRKLQSQVEALRQLPPAVAKERQAWLDRMSEANRAANGAAKAGDKTLAKRKDSEAEEYSRKGREIRDNYLASVRRQVEQLEARQKTLDYRGSEVRVVLLANERYPRRVDPSLASEVVAGNVPTPKSPGLKVHNVRAVMEGPAARREAILAAFDRDKLARVAR